MITAYGENERYFISKVYRKYEHELTMSRSSEDFERTILDILSNCTMNTKIYRPKITRRYAIKLAIHFKQFSLFRYYTDKTLEIRFMFSFDDTVAFHLMCHVQYKRDQIKQIFKKHLDLDISRVYFTGDDPITKVFSEDSQRLGLFPTVKHESELKQRRVYPI